MTTLIVNIKQLTGIRHQAHVLKGDQLAHLQFINDAFLLIEDGIIADFGQMDELASSVPALPANTIDATGQFILPAWCDSHTHLVFAGSRENEFVDKIKGLSYAEIA